MKKQLALALVWATLAAWAVAEGPFDKKVSVNVKDLEARAVFGMLSQQTGVAIAVSPEVASNKITYVGENRSLKEVFDEISSQYAMNYSINGGMVMVGASGGGSVHVAGATAAAPEGASGQVHMIPLKYGNCQDMAGKLASLISKGERVMPDDASNSILFVGSDPGYAKAKDMVALLDVAPKQILIQGMIIETSEKFLRSMGVSMGDPNKVAVGNNSVAYSRGAMPDGANLGFAAGSLGGVAGDWGSHILDIKLAAAESHGDAKVISRPKVVTLNNRQASMSSGLSINVKTLSATQSAEPGKPPVSVSGGLSTVNAGLNVDITPTIVGDNEVRLVISISSSSPDTSTSVDGIPGVQTNSAKTTVIVKNEKTAVIAGLIKQTKGDSRQGVPFLMDIPILGYLFSSRNKEDNKNELAIFITPTVLNETGNGFYPAEVPSPKKLLREVGSVSPGREREDAEELGKKQED